MLFQPRGSYKIADTIWKPRALCGGRQQAVKYNTPLKAHAKDETVDLMHKLATAGEAHTDCADT